MEEVCGGNLLFTGRSRNDVSPRRSAERAVRRENKGEVEMSSTPVARLSLSAIRTAATMAKVVKAAELGRKATDRHKSTALKRMKDLPVTTMMGSIATRTRSNPPAMESVSPTRSR